MERKEDILKELMEIAPKLAAMEKFNPYRVPSGYFLGFKDMMLQKLKTETAQQELNELAPALAALNKGLVKEVPATYFSSFSGELIKKIRANEVAAELSAVAPQLSKLEKVNALQVPANYFSAFPQKMAKQVRVKQKAGSSVVSGWVASLNNMLDGVVEVIFKPKYSVAFAGFTTMLIIGVMMFMKIEQCNDLECRFAMLSNDEINNYLDNKSDAYSDEVFEMKVDVSGQGGLNLNNTHAFKDALKDVDDAALNAAIAD